MRGKRKRGYQRDGDIIIGTNRQGSFFLLSQAIALLHHKQDTKFPEELLLAAVLRFSTVFLVTVAVAVYF